jgi:hypothetical protein
VDQLCRSYHNEYLQLLSPIGAFQLRSACVHDSIKRGNARIGNETFLARGVSLSRLARSADWGDLGQSAEARGGQVTSLADAGEERVGRWPDQRINQYSASRAYMHIILGSPPIVLAIIFAATANRHGWKKVPSARWGVRGTKFGDHPKWRGGNGHRTIGVKLGHYPHFLFVMRRLNGEEAVAPILCPDCDPNCNRTVCKYMKSNPCG